MNGDGRLNLTDPLVSLRVLVGGLDRPFDCVAASDVDADGTIDLSDAITALNWLFQGGPSPAEPFSACSTAQERSAECRVSSLGCS